MIEAMARLIPISEELTNADPRLLALKNDLPHGEPWGWALAQAILSATTLAKKVMSRAPAGLLSLMDEELEALRQLRESLRKAHPLSDLGTRPAVEAEWAALEVLEKGHAEELVALYQRFGHAPFATRGAFVWDGALRVVARPDPATFECLVGYDQQIKRLRSNVERFLSGKPGLQTLLYGARGTGKSTAVRALRTVYETSGLRLIELFPEGFDSLPELFEALYDLPQRFILFIDDLSFDQDSTLFRKFKSLLEGALFERPENVLLIATSNRRNLVRETWADREGPAPWESSEELHSLADRFGLVLTFPPFDKRRYLEAVACHLGTDLDEATTQAALRFALEGRGFSGRSAKQFADHWR